MHLKLIHSVQDKIVNNIACIMFETYILFLKKTKLSLEVAG